MPIISPAQDDADLQQGDLLEDIVTVSTGLDGGPLAEAPGRVLVVSRNCHALRAGTVTVARVKPRKVDVKSANGPVELKELLLALRDGVESPDSFYLGEFEPGAPDRYFAKFDALFTIRVPTTVAERKTWVQARRKWRLAPDFCHDLHHRLFRAFASMGFDDNKWWSDTDLDLILQLGTAAISADRAIIDASSAKIALIRASGGSNEAKGHEAKLTDARKRLDELEPELEPLRCEFERRQLQGATPLVAGAPAASTTANFDATAEASSAGKGR